MDKHKYIYIYKYLCIHIYNIHIYTYTIYYVSIIEDSKEDNMLNQSKRNNINISYFRFFHDLQHYHTFDTNFTIK